MELKSNYRGKCLTKQINVSGVDYWVGNFTCRAHTTQERVRHLKTTPVIFRPFMILLYTEQTVFFLGYHSLFNFKTTHAHMAYAPSYVALLTRLIKKRAQ